MTCGEKISKAKIRAMYYENFHVMPKDEEVREIEQVLNDIVHAYHEEAEI